jgi:hypothetical protein
VVTTPTRKVYTSDGKLLQGQDGTISLDRDGVGGVYVITEVRDDQGRIVNSTCARIPPDFVADLIAYLNGIMAQGETKGDMRQAGITMQ